MPELPEVETICRLLRTTLEDRPIVRVQVVPDPIVFKGIPAEQLEKHLEGNRVTRVGRKGKFFWLELEAKPALLGHLGMSGWVEEFDSNAELPRFTKLALYVDGTAVAFKDARRLGRLWLADDPRKDRAIAKLGFDALEELPSAEALQEALRRRTGPIKGVLLDQTCLAGIGNYLADEILYHSRIPPKAPAAELSRPQVETLRRIIRKVIKAAVDVGADETKFPANWLFHHRWGGKRGPEKIGGRLIVREEVAGRTTAWVPSVQSPKDKA